MNVEVLLGSAVGTGTVLFLGWASWRLLKLRAWREERRQEEAFVEAQARHWGVERMPGESVESLRARTSDVVRGQARYPRELV